MHCSIPSQLVLEGLETALPSPGCVGEAHFSRRSRPTGGGTPSQPENLLHVCAKAQGCQLP